MSTQSIRHKNTESLLDNSDKLYMCISDKYMIKNKFGVGGDIDLKDIKLILWLDRILCEDNCLISNLSELAQEQLNLLLIKYS